jgi:predicted DCC family thiol-disulfide oxidoreductase YuxK
MSHTNTKHKVILFDGVCNLCNSSVTLVIKNDKAGVFRFAALQSEIGAALIAKFDVDTSKTDSILLIDQDKIYAKSTAALKIAKELSGAYPLLYGFMIIPNFIRNWVYDFIAKHRYKWFGKTDMCMIPTPELKNKFL